MMNEKMSARARTIILLLDDIFKESTFYIKAIDECYFIMFDITTEDGRVHSITMSSTVFLEYHPLNIVDRLCSKVINAYTGC